MFAVPFTFHVGWNKFRSQVRVMLTVANKVPA